MSDRRPCQFFLRGSCRFGSNCRDYHPNGSIFGQGINCGNGGDLGTSSGFGTRGQFNPFSGFSSKSISDVNSNPLGNYGGPFGRGGVGGFGSGSGSGPFGSTTGTGAGFGAGAGTGASPFGSATGTGFGVGFGSGASPFGSTTVTGAGFGAGASPFGSATGTGTGFGSSPFASGPFGSSSSSSSSDGNSSKSEDPMLQTLELIGVVVNSGVWPFGRIGLLNSQLKDASQNQMPVFPSLDLSIEEYRWRFYQNDPSSWGKLHSETLSLLTQQYNSFIEQGKVQSKLPPTHRLYDLDFSLFSKIGNWYLPNLGKDFMNNKSNTNKDGTGIGNASTLGSTMGSSPFGGVSSAFSKSPFEKSSNGEGSSGTGLGAPAVSSSVNVGTPFGVINTSFNTSPLQLFAQSSWVKVAQTFPTASGSLFGNGDNPPSLLHPEGAGKSYSSNNPDVNDDNLLGCQTLQDWEIQAFQGPAFEENKIPEKVPPKHLRT